MAAGFYVYALIDPRSATPFYVGKGSGNRIESHFKEARRGGDSAKCCLIREITEQGFAVERRILKRFKAEDAAYHYEKRLIAKIGINNLTNLSPGGRCGWPVKPDSQREGDLVIVKWAKKQALIEERGLIPIFRFGGCEFAIPEKVIAKFKAMFVDVYKRRGERWLARQGLVIAH